MDKLTLLSHINLFKELPMEDMKLIDDNSTMTLVKKGTQILIPEQPLDILFFLKKRASSLVPDDPARETVHHRLFGGWQCLWINRILHADGSSNLCRGND